MKYNIYFGTIGKTLGIKYRFTKYFKTEKAAKDFAKSCATNFYYKNEGKYGLPSYIKIAKESELLNIPIEKLYEEHIEDFCRWYVIPTNFDTVSYQNIKVEM